MKGLLLRRAPWEDWDPCDVDCGEKGETTRRRKCVRNIYSAQAGQHHKHHHRKRHRHHHDKHKDGKDCPGEGEEDDVCQNICPACEQII